MRTNSKKRALLSRPSNPPVAGDQLLGKFAACRILDLCELGVARDQIEECRGVELQILGCSAFEREIILVVPRQGCKRLDRREQCAALASRDRVHPSGQIGFDSFVGGSRRPFTETVRLDRRDGHHQVHGSTVDLPYGMRLAARVAGRRTGGEQERQHAPAEGGEHQRRSSAIRMLARLCRNASAPVVR
jgi:hypothetical protein